ncbi:MAG: hypothetical protein R3C62_17240 [Chloroflexota bacterium]
MAKRLIWLGLLLLAGCGGVAVEETAVSPTIPQAAAPADPRPQFANYAAAGQHDQFAWDLFLFVNWPAVPGERGVADGDKKLGEGETAVWQTWKNVAEVYVPAGQTPLPWNSPIVPPLLETNIEIDGRLLTDKQGRPTLAQVNQNEATFDYIVNQRKIYNRAGQAAFFTDSAAPPIDFPAEAMEVKAIWRILDAAEQQSGRYHVTEGCYSDDNGDKQCATLGLTAFHLISKVQAHWFWATFEQVDNQQTTNAPVVEPIAPAVAKLNEAMQAQLVGTPWQYYQLRGSQWSFMQDDQPVILANTQIETQFQQSSSCMTCHALSSIGASNSRAEMWNFADGNVEGYTGDPPPLAAGKFKSLDYVWSLRRAK